MGIAKEQSFITAKRLKLLRESRGLSHERLSKALAQKYGIRISSDSLMNYEADSEFHSKKYKNQGMRVEYLRCLADFYEVSSDYILGLTDIKDKDLTVREIVKSIGITEENISFLMNPPEYFWDDPVSKYKESMYALANLLISCCKHSEVTEPFENLYIIPFKKLHATEDTHDPFVDTIKRRGFEVLSDNDCIAFRAGQIAENIKKIIIEKYCVTERPFPTCDIITYENGHKIYVE